PPRPDENTAGVVVVAAADQAEQLQQGQAQPPETKIRKKRKGRDHGGLPVTLGTLVHLRGGIKQLLLTRWDSSGAAIIKGEGYLDFIARCGLMEKDVVHVWAFKQREFRIFGATYPEKPLYMVIASAPRRAAAPQLPLPMPMPMPPT
uniref:Uncharacterized protein n=1 Tax=Oryza brachyantha TaxID=4533 RepID=J3MRW3_ORYBR